MHLPMWRCFTVWRLPSPLQGLPPKPHHDPQHEGALRHPDFDHHGCRHCRHDLCRPDCRVLSDHNEDVKGEKETKEESGANQPVHGGQGEGGVGPEEQQLCQPSWFKHFEQQWRHNRQHPDHSWPGVEHIASCKPSSWSKRSNNVDTAERRVPGQLWRHLQSQPQRQQQSKLQQQ